MTVEQPRIEAVGDHDYRVRVALGGDLVTIRMRATPEVVARVGGTDVDEIRVVAATMAFLTARQGADDLPEQIDLDDVVAAYDDYVDDVRTLLTNRKNTPSGLDTATEDVAVEKNSLSNLVSKYLAAAHNSNNGRSAHTLYGGLHHSLRQTLIALTAGASLPAHDSLGEATLQVLHGHVRLTSINNSCDCTAEDHVVVSGARHGLEAIKDSVVLLTVAKPVLA